MVVFTCNHCGESLQKPKVEKHYQFTCRAPKNLTCVDCFKDFRGEDYGVHNKCITEEERYAAKGSMPNGVVKKGEVKQESWVEMIKSILDKEKNMLPSHRNLFNSIVNFSNVPRKKAKFINFVKSSSGGRANMKDVEAVWDIIEKYKASQSTNANPEQQNGTTKTENGTTNGSSETTNGHENGNNEKGKKKNKENNEEITDSPEDTEKPKKSKKKKLEESVEEQTDTPKTKKKKKLEENSEDIGEETNNKKKKLNENVENGDEPKTKKKKKSVNGMEVENGETENSAFDFQATILSILQEKTSISLRKLEKKFIKLYSNHYGEISDLEKVSKKFNKRLKKIDNVTITNNTVNYTLQ